jgi:hypothetical protein
MSCSRGLLHAELRIETGADLSSEIDVAKLARSARAILPQGE